MRVSHVVALSLALCACGGPSPAETEAARAAAALSGVANFQTVRPGLYRGGRPDDAALTELKKMGVKTIVDLEINNFIEARGRDIDHEQAKAAALGLDWVHKPMSAFTGVDDAQMQETLAVLRDPAAQPVFVHCLHGQDRTGLVIGLERVFDEGWAPKDAHDEMLSDGFHTAFVGLNHYFEEQTHWED